MAQELSSPHFSRLCAIGTHDGRPKSQRIVDHSVSSSQPTAVSFVSERTHIPVIGIVGGIGSGKSSVARWVATRHHDVSLINGDQVGHEVLTEAAVRDAVRKRFGEPVFNADGQINRQAPGRLFSAPAENANRRRTTWSGSSILEFGRFLPTESRRQRPPANSRCCSMRPCFLKRAGTIYATRWSLSTCRAANAWPDFANYAVGMMRRPNVGSPVRLRWSRNEADLSSPWTILVPSMRLAVNSKKSC